MNLLQRLNELQARDGWLPQEALRELSEAEGIPLYRLQEVATFYPHYRLQPPPGATVHVCRDAACHLDGSATYLKAVREALAGRSDVEIHEVSCIGRCEHAPAAAVDDVPLEGWSADDVAAVARGERAPPPDEPTTAPRRWPTDPHACADDHYGVLERLLADVEAARRDVPEILQAAGLRGMGGAGFPTGLQVAARPRPAGRAQGGHRQRGRVRAGHVQGPGRPRGAAAPRDRGLPHRLPRRRGGRGRRLPAPRVRPRGQGDPARDRPRPRARPPGAARRRPLALRLARAATSSARRPR